VMLSFSPRHFQALGMARSLNIVQGPMRATKPSMLNAHPNSDITGGIRLTGVGHVQNQAENRGDIAPAPNPIRDRNP